MELVTRAHILDEVVIELNLPYTKVSATVDLLEQDNTIPFISRYRKEITGDLNEIEIRDIKHWWERLNSLYEQKELVISKIKEQGKLTTELEAAILKAKSASIVEELYAPFKRKRKTKADIAREHGLEPLAEKILAFDEISDEEIEQEFINEKVTDMFAAFQGAKEIIADQVGHDLEIKERVKDKYQSAHIEVSLTDESIKNDEKALVFKDYFEHKEDILKISNAPHRTLAINRGDKEGILKLKIDIAQKDELISSIKTHFHPSNKTSSSMERHLNRAIDLAYAKYLAPSVKAEKWRELKERAFENAIGIFTKNLETLLLTPPISGHLILGIDPGYRSGCKLAIVNSQGGLLYTDTLYFHTSGRQKQAQQKLEKLLGEYPITLIAIGDGTASRETEEIVNTSTMRQSKNISYLIVPETGASVYSASEVAIREFPDLDVTLRGTISICRRVQDPLAEYVKIDPKSLGVGQYQHDVPQSELKEALTETVESVVNRIGVNVNTASPELLSYVSGITKIQAQLIYEHAQQSPIRSRKEILKIKRVGPKTYEQAAGFLRIQDATVNPLDATGIHPESYAIAEAILTKVQFPLSSLNDKNQRKLLREKLNNFDLDRLRRSLSSADVVGVYTFQDIIDGLKAPFRDPRKEIDAPILRTNLVDIDSLEVGQELQGTIRNVTSFGAFVDIGLKNAGLIHISELANYFVKDPFDVVAPGDRVTVKVISFEKTRGRIGLSMKQTKAAQQGKRKQPIKDGFSKKKEKTKLSMDDLRKQFGR